MKSIERIKNSEIYKRWHGDEYLVNYFFMEDKETVDFYSKKTKKITSFKVSDTIEMSEDNIFQKKGKDLEELEIQKVTIGRESALEQATQIKEEKLPREQVTKTIAILQQKSIPLWNITYITSNFNMLNIKIDARTGKTIEENVHSLLDLIQRKNEKKKY